MFGAWEVGVWKAICHDVQPDLIVGASAGAWVGWAIAGGATAEELAREWLDPLLADTMRLGLHSAGWLRPEGLHKKARELYERFRPKIPFALTLVEVPSLRLRLVRDSEITWQHLAATCSIPCAFPPVEIGGKLYVDGGFRGALPLWAAEELGCTRAIAVNCLTLWPFRALRMIMRPPAATPKLAVTLIEPPRPLGSIRDAIVWNAARIESWIARGFEDGTRALSSVKI
jgi:predicted acylesterase/phospholipase RssA